jgi:hypothetical protein
VRIAALLPNAGRRLRHELTRPVAAPATAEYNEGEGVSPSRQGDRLVRDRDTDELTPVKGLSSHIRKVWADMRKSRPVSFYLLIAMVIVLLLGIQMANYRDDPWRFALVLSLMFVFFFVAMVRAVIDCGEIVRRHLAERRELYRTTLGDKEFMSELGRRVREKRDES